MNNYSISSPYTPQPAPRPEVNAVKIELHNPQAYGSAPDASATAASSAYPQAPFYSYPQAQVYPGAQGGPAPFVPQQPLPAEKKNLIPKTQAPEPPAANFVPTATQKKDVPPALVEQKQLPPGQESKPAVDIAPIVGSLKSDNMDEQFEAIQQVAALGQNPKVPTDLLLNEDIFGGLKGIIQKDTSNLAGPTAEQQDLRAKKFNGEELNPDQDAVAEQLSPQENAEMNKQYATYTLAVMQKNFRESVNKEASAQGLDPVKLSEIPEMDTVVENMKSNPNPLVREASINALTYVAKPEDKQELGDLFSAAAANDSDTVVKETAQKAQEKVNNLI